MIAVKMKLTMTTHPFLRRNILLKVVHPFCQEEDAAQLTVSYLSWQTSWPENQLTSHYITRQIFPSLTLKIPNQHSSETTSSGEMWTMIAKLTMSSDLMQRKCSEQRLTRPYQSSYKTNATAQSLPTSRISTWKSASLEFHSISHALSEELDLCILYTR